MIVVRCPLCGTKKAIKGTIEDHINIRIRCTKRSGGCGDRFYTKSNIIKDEGQDGTKIEIPTTVRANGKITSTSILRTFTLMITGKERIDGHQDKDLYCDHLIEKLLEIRAKYIEKERKKGRDLKRWKK